MKLCSACQKELPVTAFGKVRSSKDGLSHYCLSCNRRQAKEWRASHSEQINAKRREKFAQSPEKRAERASRQKRWRSLNPDISNSIHRHNRIAIRKKVFAMYGNKCACCGESRYEFLTLDHVNGGGNKHREKETYQQLLYRIARDGISPEYRILCSNCNFAFAYSGYCPHSATISL